MMPQVPPVDDRRERISELLAQAAAAHEQFETILLKRSDPTWARWEAGFALERNLQKFLPSEVSEDQLSNWLQVWAAEYEQNGGQVTRPQYFAQRLLEALQ
jgi:hypothetical protein